MKKVLIIPSWFPTKASPYMGIFFKIQTELMMPSFDMKVLFGKPKLYGRKAILKYIKDDSIGKLENYFLETDYINSFQYKQAAFKSIKAQLNQSAEAYWKATQNYLIKNNWKPDLVHAHDAFWGGHYANYIAKKLNIPSIITHHNPLIFTNYSQEQTTLLKETVESADQLLCVSNFDKRTFLISDYRTNPIFVGNFIDEEKFRLKTSETRNKNTFQLFAVGIASKRKDFPTLLKAISVLVNSLKHQDILLTLNISDKTSDGTSLSEIKKLADELNVSQYCKFVKNLSLDELVKTYQQTDVFVSSSYFETFGVAVCEAMCCGTPVVAVNNGGIDDIINSQNGIRIDIGNYNEMAKAVENIKNGVMKFDKEKIRNSIVSKYGRKIFFNKISIIYDNI